MAGWRYSLGGTRTLIRRMSARVNHLRDLAMQRLRRGTGMRGKASSYLILHLVWHQDCRFAHDCGSIDPTWRVSIAELAVAPRVAHFSGRFYSPVWLSDDIIFRLHSEFLRAIHHAVKFSIASSSLALAGSCANPWRRRRRKQHGPCGLPVAF